ncbi:MAG: pirin family protein, partial [Phycisphaerales bacterium]|nr:pirin family protein [Phycisphaerales bacterium]
MKIKRHDTRGHFDHGWLKTWHTFSFGHYQDPEWMGFRTLRVMNEDIVQPGQGFPTHPHRDMEIITYIVEGRLEHKDSTGGGSVISKGDFQHMTAGSGIRHSEFNPSNDEPVHLYQIWIEPAERGLTPGYTDRHASGSSGAIELVASPD